MYVHEYFFNEKFIFIENILDATLENTSGNDFQITVNMIRCSDTTSTHESDCNYMYLIGGEMGILGSKLIRNISLIYPNLVKSVSQFVFDVTKL